MDTIKFLRKFLAKKGSLTFILLEKLTLQPYVWVRGNFLKTLKQIGENT